MYFRNFLKFIFTLFLMFSLLVNFLFCEVKKINLKLEDVEKNVLANSSKLKAAELDEEAAQIRTEAQKSGILLEKQS